MGCKVLHERRRRPSFFFTSRTCFWLQKNWHETAANLHDKISSLEKLPRCVETSKASVQCSESMQILNLTGILKQLRYWSVPISMSRGLLLCRYLMMIRTSQHWIPKQSHLQWVLIAAPLSRLTKKQPHPVKNPLSLSVPSCVHSVKSTKKARRPCFLPRWLQKDHLCYQSNYNCSEGNWYVYCRPCFCWCSLYGRRDGKV